jgi:hypothetical protein
MEIGHERLIKLVGRLLAGEIVLPDIQRDFVWSGSKIPRLLDSLYKEWPVGSILLWKTELSVPIKTAAVVQGDAVGVTPSILLDGQQRMTTLARVIAPERVPPDQKAPDIRFHPGLQEFKTANAIQARDPAWISVSRILADGAQFRELLDPLELEKEKEDAWYEVLSEVAKRIRDYHLPVQTLTSDDYETVAEIFNRVNTGGRPLSKGDLIMGALAARWPGRAEAPGQPAVQGGRQRIEEFEQSLAAKNWAINREVLLRIMSTLAVDSPNHTRLLGLRDQAAWQTAWERTEKAVKHAVGFLRNDVGIPGRSLLPTEYVLLLPAVFLEKTNGNFGDVGESEALGRWLLLASAFGHYSGSLETRLASDIQIWRANPSLQGLTELVRAAQEPRTPDTLLTVDDLAGKTRRSPFLKLLQIAAVKGDAKSWWGHRSITYDPESRGMSVEIHHIFPRNWLKKKGLGKHPELDTLANFAFLSKHDNIKIRDDDPGEYLDKADPEELTSQWVPTDKSLWTADRFEDFCEARRHLLAAALNDLLGLSAEATQLEPLDADEAPEPEVGAWGEDFLEYVA